MTKLKKVFVFGFFVALSFVSLNPQSFALLCKNAQTIDGSEASDQCWTQVRIPANLTEVVSAYSVLVYDFTSADTPDRGAFYARPARASADWYRIAGVTQQIIATGDYGMVLVRGKGQINLTGIVGTSGDPLYASSRSGFAGTQYAAGTPGATVSSDPIAFALETQTTGAQATIDAYMVIR